MSEGSTEFERPANLAEGATGASDPAFAEAHARWHAGVEESRRHPYGPLSPTAIFWLSREPRTLPGLPGVWRADADGLVIVELSAADGVTLGSGEPVEGRVELGPLTGTESELLGWGSIRVEVAARSGQIAVRPRDPASQARADYAGTSTFAPSEKWLISAEFKARPRADVSVSSAAGPDRQQHYSSPGIARFSVGDATVELTLFGSFEGDDLRAIFADASGADATFPAARFVDVKPGPDGTLVIDFNRAVNPPAAYSAAATCPFPPAENRLPVRIDAGELRPAPGPGPA